MRLLIFVKTTDNWRTVFLFLVSGIFICIIQFWNARELSTIKLLSKPVRVVFQYLHLTHCRDTFHFVYCTDKFIVDEMTILLHMFLYRKNVIMSFNGFANYVCTICETIKILLTTTRCHGSRSGHRIVTWPGLAEKSAGKTVWFNLYMRWLDENGVF
jgi:hypothetical protein